MGNNDLLKMIYVCGFFINLIFIVNSKFTKISNWIDFESYSAFQPLPFDANNCGKSAFGNPVKLETADGMIFFLVGRKQCDPLRFWIYIVGSSLEARHYSYTLTVTNNAGDKQYNHKGQVFTLDSYEVATGSDSLFSL